MKDLVFKSLINAWLEMDKSVPMTKEEVVYLDISNIHPLDIPKYMKDNNIPDDAWFGGSIPGDYESYATLRYNRKSPTTKEDCDKYRRTFFSNFALRFVCSLFVPKENDINTYIEAFEYKYDTSVYDMYLNKDAEKLYEYYSKIFSRETKI